MDERFRCRCPANCSQRATQEDRLCDTCRPRQVFACDPPIHQDSGFIIARAHCVHIWLPGDELDQATKPLAGAAVTLRMVVEPDNLRDLAAPPRSVAERQRP